jgi:[acyl-carrier-protein] S-malonyltransferase
MTFVVIFNGQGEQRREHVERLLREAAPDIAEPLNAALREQGISLDRVTNEELLANGLAQPTICAYQLTIWRQLAPLVPKPALFAGYSLGELTSFACAAGMTAAEVVKLAAVRARLMDESVTVPSGLLAVFGLKEEVLRALCRKHSTEIAIRNGFESFIVGGSADALMQLAEEAAKSGANRVTRLGVPTPSHTSRLAGAARRFGAELRGKMQERLDIPAVSGVDGKVVRSGQVAVASLEKQVASTIDWAACMETIVSFRPQAVLEIGPGSALSRMLRDFDQGLEVRAVDDFRLPTTAADWVHSRLA